MNRKHLRILLHSLAAISWIVWIASVVDDLETDGWKAATMMVVSHVGAEIIAQAIGEQFA